MADDAGAPVDGEFPRFNDGDVLIVLSPSRQYQLHSRTLRLHSTFFKHELTEERAAQPAGKAQQERYKVRYRVELKHPIEGDFGELILRPITADGRIKSSYTVPDVDNGREPAAAYSHYDNLFRAYYYQDMNLDDTHMHTLLRAVVGLVEVAEYIGSLKVVSMAVDHSLMKQGQYLYRSISSNAAVWADLAYRIRSENIFKEAIIHMVGQWNKIKSRTDMKTEIRELCEAKAHDLEDEKRAIEMRIMGHYIMHLRRPVDSNTGPGSTTKRNQGNPTRSTQYSADIMAWMAMNLFRHWVGQQIAAGLTRHGDDGGYVFYLAISGGGAHYIDHRSIENFTNHFPLSAKSRNMFEEQLNKIKDEVSTFVKDLLKNHSQLDVRRFPPGYLTCVKVTKDDLPWIKAEKAAAAQRSRAAGRASTGSKRRINETEGDEFFDEIEEAAGRSRKTARHSMPIFRGSEGLFTEQDETDPEAEADEEDAV